MTLITKRKILDLPELSARIKELATNSPYTVTEVFDHAGIPVQYNSKWRKGHGRPPYYSELARVAEKFDVPVDVLIYADEDPYVHIPKKKFAQMLEILKDTAGTIISSELFDYQKFTG